MNFPMPMTDVEYHRLEEDAVMEYKFSETIEGMDKETNERFQEWINKNPDASWTEAVILFDFKDFQEDEKITKLKEMKRERMWYQFFVSYIVQHDIDFYNKYKLLF